MGTHAQKGFTLIELAVTVTIVSILLGVGVPSFLGAIKNSCTSSDYNSVVGALMYARSEAVKSAQQVTVCPRGSDTSCGTSWNNGMIVFADNTIIPNETIATIDGTDDIISVQSEMSCENTLSNFASTDRTASTAAPRNFIRYSSDGSTDWQNGSFILCDARGSAHSRSINVVLTGDVRRGRTQGGSEIPIDVFGQELSCP